MEKNKISMTIEDRDLQNLKNDDLLFPLKALKIFSESESLKIGIV